MSTQALVFTKFPIKMGAGVLFLVWSDGRLYLTDYLHLVPRLRMSETEPLHSLYSFTAEEGQDLIFVRQQLQA
jgi:hypothetical protein